MGHKYRFKTEAEFEEEYGDSWYEEIEHGWDDCMDYLFGQPLPDQFLSEYEDNLEFEMEDDNQWNTFTVGSDMIIKEMTGEDTSLDISIDQKGISSNLIHDDGTWPHLNTNN